jgi:hypothetical protein
MHTAIMCTFVVSKCSAGICQSSAILSLQAQIWGGGGGGGGHSP